MSLTFQEFKEKVPDSYFIKFVNNNCTHHCLHYQLGLNVDTIEFNPRESCKPGGLYFTTNKFFDIFTGFGKNIALIELCEDAQFYMDPGGKKYKTDKFIIQKYMSIPEYLMMLYDKEELSDFLEWNPPMVKYLFNMANQNLEKIVKDNIYLIPFLNKSQIYFIQDLIKNICNERNVQISCEALLNNSSQSVQYKQIIKKPSMLKDILNPNLELYKKVLDFDYEVIQYIHDPTEEISLYALSINLDAIEFIDDHTDTICFYILGKDPSKFKLLNNRNKALCEKAIELSPDNAQYIPNKYDDENMERDDENMESEDEKCEEQEDIIDENNDDNKENVNDDNETEEIEKYTKLLDQNPYSFESFDKQYEKVCDKAIQLKPKNLKYIKKQNLEQCLSAIMTKHYGFTFKYVDFNYIDHTDFGELFRISLEDSPSNIKYLEPTVYKYNIVLSKDEIKEFYDQIQHYPLFDKYDKYVYSVSSKSDNFSTSGSSGDVGPYTPKLKEEKK